MAQNPFESNLSNLFIRDSMESWIFFVSAHDFIVHHHCSSVRPEDTTILFSRLKQVRSHYVMNGGLLFLSTLLWLTVTEGNHRVLDVAEFGAVGDGITEDTVAIRRAIAYAADSTSSIRKIIHFPANKTFVSAPLNLTSNMVLQIDGVLKAITNTSENFEEKWPQILPLENYASSEDNGRYLQYQAFLYSRSATNVTIQGSGVVDAMGPWWWYAFHHDRQALAAGRPNLIQLVNCKNVEITGILLKDSPFWTIHPVFCDNVHIHHMSIRAPMYAPNVDGVDPDSSSNVLIEHNDISCGDDHIAVKSGRCGLGTSWIDGLNCLDNLKFASGDFLMSNLTIRYNIFRIGMGIALGSEISGGVENVNIHNNVIGLCEHGHEDPNKSCGWGHAFHIKTTLTRGGYFRNVRFANNVIYNNTGVVFIETDYQSNFQKPPPYPTTEIKNISIVGNSAIGEAHAMTFGCSKYMPCKEMTVKDNWIAYGNDNGVYDCSNVTSYDIANNSPSGLEECMKASTLHASNDTSGIIEVI